MVNRPIPRLFPPFLLLLLLPGCEESLPPYAPPNIPLAARIEIDNSIDANELTTIDNGFTVIIAHTGELQNDFVLLAPYEARISITIAMAEAPSRSITVSRTVSFGHNLYPGYWDYHMMNIPPRDADGNLWNWPLFESRVRMVLQGKVQVFNEEYDLEINTPRAVTILRYDTP